MNNLNSISNTNANSPLIVNSISNNSGQLTLSSDIKSTMLTSSSSPLQSQQIHNKQKKNNKSSAAATSQQPQSTSVTASSNNTPNKKNNNKRDKKYNNNNSQKERLQQPVHNYTSANDLQYNSEIELAIAMSKVEFEQQLQGNDKSSTSLLDVATADNTGKGRQKKKNHVDMTHLVHFKQERSHSHWDYRSGGGSTHSNSSNHHHHPSRSNSNNSQYKKKVNNKPANPNSFLQANYLFKVNPYGNYKSSLSNPEYIVAWNKIEQVVYLSKSSEFLCPICFESPIAPKVTKCGHISCYACILRSLSHSNKCPLCLKPIESSELKSVTILKSAKYDEGDSIEFQLLKYREDTTVPYLANQTIPELISFPIDGDANAFYSRFSIIYTIDDILEKERIDVATAKEIAMSEGEFETVRFLANAEKEIEERGVLFQKLAEQKKNEGNGQIIISSIPRKNPDRDFKSYQFSNNSDVRTDLQEYYSDVLNNIHWEDASEEDENRNNHGDSDSLNDNESGNDDQESDKSKLSTSTTTTNAASNNTPQSVDDHNQSFLNQAVGGVYYLYQCVDGQPIFIHPLNMNMLSREAAIRGATATPASVLPPLLKSKVLDIEPYEIARKSRHIYRSLNLLALTTSVWFVEVDLSSVVSKAVLDEFAPELKKRRDVRNSKKRQETRKEKKKVQEREHDIKRSKEIKEQYEKIQEEERERKRIEKEKEDAEEAERLKNEPFNPNKPKPNSFINAINKYKCPDEEFKFSLSDSNTKKNRRR